MFILPPEARWIRRVEAQALAVAQAHGFEEVVFPRAMPLAQWQEVAEVLGPLSGELGAERVLIPDLGVQPHALCHWQCEPYYRGLRHWGEQTPPRVVDRSGFSYRNEARIGPHRGREFLRVELVWRGTQAAVAALFDALLRDFEAMLHGLALPVERRRRDDEIRASRQRDVVDLVLPAVDGAELELLGAHQHGDVFVRHFWPAAPADTVTACLGLSLSRVARLLAERGDAA